ncbi:MAG: Ig-like domain-containing protein [Inhella sp.]
MSNEKDFDRFAIAGNAPASWGGAEAMKQGASTVTSPPKLTEDARTIKGELSVSGEVDLVSVYLQRDRVYNFVWSGIPGMSVKLMDAGLQPAAVQFSGSSIQVPTSGEYYLAVSASNGTTGSYTLAAPNYTGVIPSLEGLAALRNASGQLELLLRFNEPVLLGTGSLTLEVRGDGKSAPQKLTISTAPTSGIRVEGSNVYVPLNFAIRPDADFDLKLSRGFVENIAGRDFANDTGTWTFRTPKGPAMPDDHGNERDLATLLTPEGVIPGALEYFGDRDVFRAELKAGYYYQFVMVKVAADAAAYPQMFAQDSMGRQLSSHSFRTTNTAVWEFVAEQTGTVYITPGFVRLAGEAPESYLGSYRMQLTELGDDRPPGQVDTMALGGIGFSGRMDHILDEEKFRITLVQGETYALTLRPKGTEGPPQTDLRVIDPGGKLIAKLESAESDKSTVLSFVAALSGTHFVTLGASWIGDYQISAVRTSSQPQDDYPLDRPGLISLGDQLNPGRVEVSGDIDYFEVRLQAGMNYGLNVSLPSSGDLKGVTLKLSLPSGEVFHPGFQFSPSGQSLYFQAPVDGLFKLVLQARQGEYGNYSLGVYSLPIRDDVRQGASSPLQVGKQQAGDIEYFGDTDRYAVSLVGGVEYLLSANPASTFGSQAVNPILRLRGPDSTMIAENDDFGGKSSSAHIFYRAPASGTYYLDVSGAKQSSGAYQVSAMDVQSVDTFPRDDDGLGRSLDLDEPLQGEIQWSRDTDIFSFRPVAGYGYELRIAGAGANPLGAVKVSLKLGTNLLQQMTTAQAESNGDIVMRWKASQTDYHLVIVEGLNGSIGSYRIVFDEADLRGPTMVGSRPSDNATQLARNSSFEFDFSEAVRAGAGSFRLYGQSGNLLQTLDARDSARVEWMGSKVVLRPKDELPLGASVYWLIDEGAVTDSSGNRFAGVQDRTALSFTTVTSDDHAARSAGSGRVLVNERAASGRVEAARDVDWFQVDLKAGAQYSFQLTPSGFGWDAIPALSLVDPFLQAIAATTSQLSDGSRVLSHAATYTGTYFIAVAAGTGLGSYQVSAREVDQRAPALKSLDLAALTVPAARNTNLALLFDEPIKAGSGAIELRNLTTGELRTIAASDSRQVSVDGNKLIVNPGADLTPGRYELGLTAGAVLDLDGNALLGLGKAPGQDFSVSAVNGAPTASGLQRELMEDASFSGSVAYAKDPDGDTLSYHLLAPAEHGEATLSTSGTLTYKPPVNWNGQQVLQLIARDGMGAEVRFPVTLTVWSVQDQFKGTAGADRMPGFPGWDNYFAMEGDDWVEPGKGNDQIDGGSGLDHVVLSGPRSEHQLQAVGQSWTVRHPSDGTKKLVQVERIHFSDLAVALDLHGAAGMAARVVGAVFGPSFLTNRELMGLAIQAADQGLGTEELVRLALAQPLFKQLAGGDSASALVGHVFNNVVGRSAQAEELRHFSDLIESGSQSAAALVSQACLLELTAIQINLIGLFQQGLEYEPVGP